jgi:hypothetical protein
LLRLDRLLKLLKLLKGHALRQALEGVWSPDRLLLLNPCQTITSKIDDSKLPQYLAEDGDVHNQFAPDKQYRKLLTDQQETYGNFVVELMARDGGHLPVPPVGPKLTLWGRWSTIRGTLGRRFIPSMGFAWRVVPVIQAGPSLGVLLQKPPVTQETLVAPRPASSAPDTKASYQPTKK